MRAFAALLLLVASAGAVEPPREWLVLGPVDDRGRAPFQPDRVFARYLLRRDAAPPKEGEVVGDKAWRKSGELEGEVAYAYATVACDEACVALARLTGAATLFVNGDGFVGDVYGQGTAPPAVPLRKGTNHLFVRALRGKATLSFEPVVEGVRRAPEDSGFGARVLVNASATSAESLVPFGIRKVAEAGALPEGCRAFVSRIDGSVQWYAIREATGDHREARIVLALHGAGVDALSHARAYSPKPDFWIVAPNNRRPFGFDWQDWGRLDAYEAWEDALRFTGAPRAPTYLTGHSMGGHGTWHLAANDPDAFAAIAPSAGWISFETYGNARPTRFPDLPSRTLDLLPNLAAVPTCIVHGLRDDNVPPTESERMNRELRLRWAKPELRLQPQAGHWWDGDEAEGVDCVDLPAIFDWFRRHRGPSGFVGGMRADPAWDSSSGNVHVGQLLEYGKPFRFDFDGFENVRRIKIAAMAPVALGGQPQPGNTWLVRDGGTWRREEPPPNEKSPGRSGPFKRTFDNRFVMVFGAGDREGLARARYDAQVWYYRANGDGRVLSDEEFLSGGFAGRNVILYGNASTNRAWRECVPESCPIRAETGKLTVGAKAFEGDDLAALFVHPRRGDDRAVVGVFAHTGDAGARLGYTLLPFTSGVCYPDYAAFDASLLGEGEAALLAGGWFRYDWSLPE